MSAPLTDEQRAAWSRVVVVTGTGAPITVTVKQYDAAALLDDMREELEAIVCLRDYEDRRDRLSAYLTLIGLS